jgi:3-phosphoshikimate 1-carboxyvinyltransferase
VEGLERQSKQGDMRLLKILEKLGCRITYGDKWIEVACRDLADGDFTFDLNDMPDMVPTLAVLAAFRRGKTIITNVAHLRLKESNRLQALACELTRIGIAVQETADGLAIDGCDPRPAQIETYNDHRIAMSFAVAALVVPGIIITDRKCVDKSFPGFWAELKKI